MVVYLFLTKQVITYLPCLHVSKFETSLLLQGLCISRLFGHKMAFVLLGVQSLVAS